jgi:hypothetical protein
MTRQEAQAHFDARSLLFRLHWSLLNEVEKRILGTTWGRAFPAGVTLR